MWDDMGTLQPECCGTCQYYDEHYRVCYCRDMPHDMYDMMSPEDGEDCEYYVSAT